MFSNLNWYNVVILLLLALFIFGDKLPQVISDGLRMLRNLRRTAQNATSDLSRELGTNIQLEDLHPKTFIRKHVLSEAEQEALTRPVRDLANDLRREGESLTQDIGELTADDRPGSVAPSQSPAPQQEATGRTGRRLHLDDVT